MRQTPLKPGKPPDRKTELKPGKGLKRGGKIRKKPRPRDRELWGNKHWRDECDKLWSRIVRQEAVRRAEAGNGVYCAMCATRPPGERVNAKKWDAHHLINRGQMFYRHIIENGICLCSQCHENNAYFSARHTPHAFDARLKEYYPDQHAWYAKNRNETHPGLSINYRQVYDVLRAKLDSEGEML